MVGRNDLVRTIKRSRGAIVRPRPVDDQLRALLEALESAPASLVRDAEWLGAASGPLAEMLPPAPRPWTRGTS